MKRVKFKKGAFEEKRFSFVKGPIYVVDVTQGWAAIEFTNFGMAHCINVPEECLEYENLETIDYES